MNPNFNINAQAQIFVGPDNDLIDYTHSFLQSIFCKNNGCKTCVKCNQIRQNSYSNICWLKPEKQYTLEDIDVVFEKIAFSLDENEKFFIIFENADLLNQSCSNKLLKSIEEPKSGYYFIFLTQKKEQILITIRSRCLITNFYKEDFEENNSELYNFFINVNSNPIQFLKTLDKININEHESIGLLDSIIKYWLIRAKQELLNGNIDKYNYSSHLLNIFTESFKKPPMPGSSKIFWKNLYIKFNK